MTSWMQFRKPRMASHSKRSQRVVHPALFYNLGSSTHGTLHIPVELSQLCPPFFCPSLQEMHECSHSVPVTF
uniref:Uncharacterized protein n=1 Tax=Anguilla anguilla TaxID=7936 RepID=A0A0E9WGZ7_ANGAN